MAEALVMDFVERSESVDFRDDPKVQELARSVVRATKGAISIAKGERRGRDINLLLEEMGKITEEMQNEGELV
ncbi:MAG: hypothetical protein LBE35_02280 [Clostridiales bacterium]|jgi:hypothetical protein|nr:hypothetical protein [Clostridiales bacterium]